VTGKLGEVMQESAKAAIPKDGPSAGITMVTSIVSALLGVPVRRDLAMTGEITLRGHVLPIGGLTEKLLAARRGNIGHVLIPKENNRNLEEVSPRIRKSLDIEFVDHMDEVLEKALVLKEGESLFSDVPIETTYCPEIHMPVNMSR